jgi:alanine transaminase
LPFNKVISTNIGNPQQTGLDQPPITFNRQVRECASFGACSMMRWPYCPFCAPAQSERTCFLAIGCGIDGVASSR